MERIAFFSIEHSKIRSRTLIQSVYVYLRLALSRISSKAVSYTNKLNSPLLKSKRLLMRSWLLARKSVASGINFLSFLVASLNLKLPSLLQNLKRLSLSLLTKLKSKLTLLRTLLSSSNFKNSWLLTFVKKKKSQEQSTTPIKTTWRQPSNE